MTLPFQTLTILKQDENKEVSSELRFCAQRYREPRHEHNRDVPIQYSGLYVAEYSKKKKNQDFWIKKNQTLGIQSILSWQNRC